MDFCLFRITAGRIGWGKGPVSVCVHVCASVHMCACVSCYLWLSVFSLASLAHKYRSLWPRKSDRSHSYIPITDLLLSNSSPCLRLCFPTTYSDLFPLALPTFGFLWLLGKFPFFFTEPHSNYKMLPLNTLLSDSLTASAAEPYLGVPDTVFLSWRATWTGAIEEAISYLNRKMNLKITWSSSKWESSDNVTIWMFLSPHM